MSQGHPRVMIYINFVELVTLMLLAKFKILSISILVKITLKVFAIYHTGSHLGQVTFINYINFCSLFLRMLRMKFGSDWPSDFRGEDI